MTSPNRLTFRDHVLKAIERANDRLAVLRSVSNSSWGSGITTKLQLYTAWIRPILEYGTLVLSTAPRSFCPLVALGSENHQLSSP